MLVLIDEGLEGKAEAVLARAKAEDLEVLAEAMTAFGGPKRRMTAAALAELFEVAEDEILELIGAWRDQRVMHGDALPAIRADLETLKGLFAVCEDEGLGPVDVTSLLGALNEPRAPSPLSDSASREEVIARLQSDPYAGTVLRRVAGIAGVIPTREFLLALARLELTHEDEPRVAALLAAIGEREVADGHAEIIAPLRAARSRS